MLLEKGKLVMITLVNDREFIGELGGELVENNSSTNFIILNKATITALVEAPTPNGPQQRKILVDVADSNAFEGGVLIDRDKIAFIRFVHENGEVHKLYKQVITAIALPKSNTVIPFPVKGGHNEN